MKISLTVLILLLVGLCFGQSSSSQIPNLRLLVAKNPVDIALRLNLAYNLALEGDYADALRNYETILIQDPDNVSAAEGVLWMMQMQGMYPESVARGRFLLQKHPQSSTIASYLAFGYARTNRHLAARSTYQRASTLGVNDLQTNAAQSGLAWAYIALQDYPAAQKALHSIPEQTDTDAQRVLDTPRMNVTANYHTDYSDVSGFGISGSWHKKNIKVSAQVAELLISNERFREKYTVDIALENHYARISAAHGILRGIDKRVYPASTSSISLYAKVYMHHLQITPALSASLGSYRRLDAQQGDAGIVVSSDRWELGARLSYVYLDRESLNSDVQNTIASLNIGLKPREGTYLGAYMFKGDQSWWISPYQVVNDEFEANDQTYALSVSQKISAKTSVMIYQELGFYENNAQHSSSFSLSYRF